MVEEELPAKVVRQLQNIVKLAELTGRENQIYEYLGKLENIDHRRALRDRPLGTLPAVPQTDTSEWGRRVRKLNRAKYRDLHVVIKRIHDEERGKSLTAPQIVQTIYDRVTKHNADFPDTKRYELRHPKLYVISRDLIAMAFTPKPSLEEVLKGTTKRGIKAMDELEHKHGLKYRQFRDAVKEVVAKTDWDPENLLLTGYKNGKLIFVPWGDNY